MHLNENERCDEVNDKLRLIQKNDGLTFGTDALLLAGYVSGKYRHGCELGSGTGIISMLLVSREKLEDTVCLEVQAEYAALTERNAELNGLSDKITARRQDIRDNTDGEVYDIVYTNPPYMRTDSGVANKTDAKNVARHEVFGTIADFCGSAAKMLKFGGAFYVVYRPDRITDLIHALRASRLEPKRLTFVHARRDSESSMVLIEAKRGGAPGAILTRPLIIYSEDGKTYSEDMQYIMDNGKFPEGYKR